MPRPPLAMDRPAPDVAGGDRAGAEANGRGPPGRPGVIVAGLAVASALVAVAGSRLLFPYLSINNDEGINRLQADAIAHGHLFSPTLGLADTFRPWLAAVSGHHYVFKYTPVVPAMIAISQLATGGPELYLAAMASATVVMTYLLAIEVLGDRAEAVCATVLVALSPLVLLHSSLLLAYLPTFLLLETFTWALIRGLSQGRSRLLVVSGLALGLAFFARAFDAAVFALPVLAWATASRPGRRPRLREATLFLLPALAVLAGFFIFNAAATGSPFKLTFSLLDPKDALGFGPRQLYPTAAIRNFGLRQSVDGVTQHGKLLGIWVAGGWILFILAAATVIRRRVHGASWALLAAGVGCPASYFFFWGPWTATVDWGGARYVGPFYFLPVLLPLALLGARSFVGLWRWHRPAGLAVSLAMVAATALVLVAAVSANLDFGRQNRSLATLVAGHAPKQLVFASMPAPFLMHPSAVIANRWDVTGPTVFAIDRGNGDLDAVHLMPGRTPFQLVYRDTFMHPDQQMAARLEQLRLVTADRVALRVVTDPPAASTPATVGMAISAFGVTRVYSFQDRAIGAQMVVVDGHGAEIAGRTPLSMFAESKPDGLEISLLRLTGASPDGAVVETERLPLARTGPAIELLGPVGLAWSVGGPTPRQLQVQLTAG